MTCERVRFGDGIVGILCSRGHRPRRRCACGVLAAYLCDAPRGARGRTCDLPLCEACRVRAGEDLDLCRVHAALAEKLRQAQARAEAAEHAAGEQLALPGLAPSTPETHDGARARQQGPRR